MYLGAIPLVDMPICIVRLSKHAQIALRGNSTPQPALKNVQAWVFLRHPALRVALSRAHYLLRLSPPALPNRIPDRPLLAHRNPVRNTRRVAPCVLGLDRF